MSWLPPFSPGRRGAGGFSGSPGEGVAGQPAQDRVARFRRQGQRRHPIGVGGDQRGLAGVPLGQQPGRGRGAHQPRMDDAGELHMRDMA